MADNRTLQLKRGTGVKTLNYYKDRLDSIELQNGEPVVILYTETEESTDVKVGFILGTEEGNKLLVGDITQEQLNRIFDEINILSSATTSALTSLVDEIEQVADDLVELHDNTITNIESVSANTLSIERGNGEIEIVDLKINVEDVYLDNIEYSGGTLTFIWNVNHENKEVNIPVSDYFSQYYGDEENGIKLSGNTFMLADVIDMGMIEI